MARAITQATPFIKVLLKGIFRVIFRISWCKDKFERYSTVNQYNTAIHNTHKNWR
jgi:hypothetical protein